ncbi:MAG: hypothetical protein NZ899_03060 [Thermoguttaceae bacterium]|nr:hypothetical protein [Thermoguttaceae bacterium]
MRPLEKRRLPHAASLPDQGAPWPALGTLRQTWREFKVVFADVAHRGEALVEQGREIVR